MDLDKFKLAPEVMVPDHFMPAIGLVMVRHAFMDAGLQKAISYLAGMDFNSGTSILSKILMTNSRVEIFQNLTRTKVDDFERLCKMLVLGDVVSEVSSQRNTIAHTLPYSYSPSEEELIYFKDVNKTSPQIRVQPPYCATVSSLVSLAEQMRIAGYWLGMLLPNCIVDGTDPEDRITECHPHWNDDAQFPWPDKFQSKVKTERHKPQNKQRKPKAPNPPSGE